MIPPRAAPPPGPTGATVGGQQPALSRLARAVPPLATVAASALAALPIVAAAPVVPPAGLLIVLGWRLLRPDLWQAWMALPLGLADDLLSGQPLGIGMASWTIAFLMLDMIDDRLLSRDYLMDWAIAAVTITGCMIAGAWATGPSDPGIGVLAPHIAVTILCFPLAERVCGALDRWRLRR